MRRELWKRLSSSDRCSQGSYTQVSMTVVARSRCVQRPGICPPHEGRRRVVRLLCRGKPKRPSTESRPAHSRAFRAPAILRTAPVLSPRLAAHRAAQQSSRDSRSGCFSTSRNSASLVRTSSPRSQAALRSGVVDSAPSGVFEATIDPRETAHPFSPRVCAPMLRP